MALVRKHNTIVHMGYAQPFFGPIVTVASMLAEGKLGQVTHARFRNSHNAAYGRWFDSPDLAWFTEASLSGGGAFMDMGTHAVHCLRSLLGPVDRVMARIGNACGAYPKVDDNGIALLQFRSGVLGTVEASWVQTGGIGGLEITGSAATVFQHPTLGYVTAAPKQEPQKVVDSPEKPRQVNRLLAAIEGKITRAELDADLVCAADAVAIMEACYQSSKSGQWVDVKSF
jgi:predicted dehydrogenase